QFLDGLLRRCVHVPASDFFDFEWILWDFGHAPVDSRVTFNSLEAFVPCSGHYDSERAMPKDRFLDPPPDPPGHVGGWAVEFRGRQIGRASRRRRRERGGVGRAAGG